MYAKIVNGKLEYYNGGIIRTIDRKTIRNPSKSELISNGWRILIGVEPDIDRMKVCSYEYDIDYPDDESISVSYIYTLDKYKANECLTSIIDDVLLKKANELGYESVDSISSYIVSGNEDWKSESMQFIRWKTACWEYCFRVLSELEENNNFNELDFKSGIPHYEDHEE